MFDKLKKAFSNAAKSISQKELSSRDLDESLFELNISLLESDVSQEVIDDLSSQIKNNLVGMKLQKNETTEEIITNTLKKNFATILDKAGSVDLIKEIQNKKQNKNGPFKIVFLGINGTGKTTTVAKVAHMLRKVGFSVVIAAADTHRAGAIEQISTHADRLSIKVISQRYGADPSAVARDALEYARKHYIDVVLIDTAGRMQTAKNLMDEIGKIVKVIKPDLKLFVGDSLAGNDTINQAKEFFTYTEFDGAILTKADADAKGGSVISISYITSKPIIYLGIGQGYDDMLLFNKDKFVETIFSNTSMIESQKQSQKPYQNQYSVDTSDKPTTSTIEASDVNKLEQEFEKASIHEMDESLLVEIQNRASDQSSGPEPENKPFSKIDEIEIEPTLSSSEIEPTLSSSEIEPTLSSDSNHSTKSESIEEKTNPRNGSDSAVNEKVSEKKSRFGWFRRKK